MTPSSRLARCTLYGWDKDVQTLHSSCASSTALSFFLWHDARVKPGRTRDKSCIGAVRRLMRAAKIVHKCIAAQIGATEKPFAKLVPFVQILQFISAPTMCFFQVQIISKFELFVYYVNDLAQDRVYRVLWKRKNYAIWTMKPGHDDVLGDSHVDSSFSSYILLPHVSESSILHVFSCCILDVFRLFIRSGHHFPIRSVVKHFCRWKMASNMHLWCVIDSSGEPLRLHGIVQMFETRVTLFGCHGAHSVLCKL